jgi:hypothetical protein
VSHADLPRVIVDDRGALRFNGCTGEERLVALDEPADTTIHQGERTASGRERAGRREGPWRFSIAGKVRFHVTFIDDRPVSPPDGWNGHEWPRPSLERHHSRRTVLELVLRKYRGPEDIERLYSRLVPSHANSVTVVQGLVDALAVSLAHAKSAVDAACERAPPGRVRPRSSATSSVVRITRSIRVASRRGARVCTPFDCALKSAA